MTWKVAVGRGICGECGAAGGELIYACVWWIRLDQLQKVHLV